MPDEFLSPLSNSMEAVKELYIRDNIFIVNLKTGMNTNFWHIKRVVGFFINTSPALLVKPFPQIPNPY